MRTKLMVVGSAVVVVAPTCVPVPVVVVVVVVVVVDVEVGGVLSVMVPVQFRFMV